MKIWEVVIRYEGKFITTLIEAKYYYDASVEAKKKYPGGIIKNILEFKN